MVQDRLSDGTRIAELLASEIEGDAGPLAALTVTDADPDVEPTADGALAYRVGRESGDEVAAVYVQPDRARVEFRSAPDAAAEAARDGGLRARPKAVRPPRTLVFVEDGAQVKRVRDVFEATEISAADSNAE